MLSHMSHNLFWASDYNRLEAQVLQQSITLLFSGLLFYPADFVLAALRVLSQGHWLRKNSSVRMNTLYVEKRRMNYGFGVHCC